MKCTLSFPFCYLRAENRVLMMVGGSSLLRPMADFTEKHFERISLQLQPNRNCPMSSHTHHVWPHQNSQWSGATETTHHLNPATHGSPRMAPNISGKHSVLLLFLSQRGLPWNLKQNLIKKQMLRPISVHLVWQIIGALLFWPTTLP